MSVAAGPHLAQATSPVSMSEGGGGSARHHRAGWVAGSYFRRFFFTGFFGGGAGFSFSPLTWNSSR